MKRLHAFILKSYIGPFILTFFLAIFLLLMQFLWKYIDDLVGKGIEGHVIAELMFYASATFVPMGLPLAILLSSIMTFGNLGERYELVALKSSGISLLRIMFPLIVFSIIISFSTFLFSNYVMPVANLKMRTLLHDVRTLRPELNLKEGVYNYDIQGYTIKIGKKNRKTNMLYKLVLYDHTDDNGNTNVTLADSGYIKLSNDEKYLIFNLYNGLRYEDVKENEKKRDELVYPFRRDRFEKQTVFIQLEGFKLERSDEDLYKDHYEMLNISQLEYAIDSLQEHFIEKTDKFTEQFMQMSFFKINKKNFDSLYKSNLVKEINLDSTFDDLKQNKKMKAISVAMDNARNAKTYISAHQKDFDYREEMIRRHEIEWHRKYSLAIACLVLFFIGAPLGAIIRKGGLGMPVVVSVLFFIVYYLISIYGEKSVREGVFSAAYGMWLSTMILFPLGIFLTYKAATDSRLFSIESYSIYIKKLTKIFKKK